MSLSARIAARKAGVPYRLICNDKGRCVLEAHTNEVLHRDGQGAQWGARDPWQPVWRREQRFRKDLTERAA